MKFPIFFENDTCFTYHTAEGEPGRCQVDLTIRADFELDIHDRALGLPYKPFGVVLITQHETEERSIGEDVSFIAAEVMEKMLIARGFNGIRPKDMIWLENFPPDKVSRYGRMERVYFQEHRKSQDTTVLTHPIEHRCTIGLVERILGWTWNELQLPEVKRYAD